MAYITGVTKGGGEWTPSFIMSIDPESCIGCGRCYKACAFDVLELIEEENDEGERYYMGIADDGNCIGCKACLAACPKDCFTHEPKEA